ncbi:50S ribosomal protein L19 [Isachenkonia alkalipeptolytica]|uniref:Large ribosomal subunit protein bL19 n=1 Tax=Isachenkonia alkalipeptolytica TaxID=2565777 RepID=A0AA43XIN7_9CLOT|nr:50S ribosomal protein L19 [Isachenkonia alkalipeptolytica]NBG87550.1 50S ribosomal protein L19 [Isachenkonia alkalipeptolytica]
MNIIDMIDKEQLKSEVPEFAPGDTVRVDVKIKEGTRERIQAFQGLVIKRQGGGIQETFTVRRIAYGVSMERTFPVHSPKVAEVKVIKRGSVRRARLFYLKNRIGKAAYRIKEKK